MGRFLNADDTSYLGANGTALSYNLFAYCSNNPVMGYDPTGYWDWGGVIVGLGIIAATVITVTTFGIGTVAGAVVATAAISTGAVTTYAAATDSALVVDISYSQQVTIDQYAKVGGSMVVDFGGDGAYFYPHMGTGKGYSEGVSYSAGIVDNFDEPTDYAEWFVDANASCYIGFDHCWDPRVSHESATKATAVTFGIGASFGTGVDWYFDPLMLGEW